jgi:hypothetical protein
VWIVESVRDQLVGARVRISPKERGNHANEPLGHLHQRPVGQREIEDTVVDIDKMGDAEILGFTFSPGVRLILFASRSCIPVTNCVRLLCYT